MGIDKKKVIHSDGGYYALKGFIYQFDKCIIEVLKNPENAIEIEYIQDISCERYCIQVKYKETQIFSPSKIKPAVIQLIDEFKKNKQKKFLLYCYFKNKTPQTCSLNLSEIKKILGKDAVNYTEQELIAFLNNFIVEFSHDFNNQFNIAIGEIKKSFKAKTIQEAIQFHAIIQTHLFKIATKKEKSKRKISKYQLGQIISTSEAIIFHSSYSKFIGNTKYIQMLKKEYFTFKKLNIPNQSRLFIIEIDKKIKESEIIFLIQNISKKYFSVDHSPAPFVCFSGIKDKEIIKIKQRLWDKKILFTDGTHFNGDRFRIQDLVANTNNHKNSISIKLMTELKMNEVLKAQSFDEIYDLFITNNRTIKANLSTIHQLYINQTKDLIKIIS
ncbi:MAG: hypothetical protein ACD_7C00126G0016 [uncultured bacterium]|nr:MAG: hypothetical protein ACD_7C00126G0016 [uncultured bacterium]HBR79155.1 hypothetical protein [Candidatus Moranbacteria bacterium]